MFLIFEVIVNIYTISIQTKLDFVVSLIKNNRIIESFFRVAIKELQYFSIGVN